MTDEYGRQVRKQLADAQAELAAAEARIAAVRALHHPSMSGRDCESCCDYSGDPLPWPCPTITALDGPAEQPAVCCMCGSTDVVYRNYLEQPFCCPCAQCCPSPADGPS